MEKQYSIEFVLIWGFRYIISNSTKERMIDIYERVRNFIEQDENWDSKYIWIESEWENKTGVMLLKSSIQLMHIIDYE